MSNLYAMQRANGDWFAFGNPGCLRMPLFSSSHEAMQARARNWGMLLFRPVVFDERALNELASTGDENGAYFWLMERSSTKLNRGNFIDQAQLALLIHDSVTQLPGQS
jgi:hypothetical protein